MDHWQDQRDARAILVIKKARVEVLIIPGKPCMHLHRYHRTPGTDRNRWNEVDQARPGFSTKLTGKVITDVCLTPSCPPRGWSLEMW